MITHEDPAPTPGDDLADHPADAAVPTSDDSATETPPEIRTSTEAPGTSARRRVAARVLTVLAAAFVLAALLAPSDLGQLTPLAFLRIPVEGLVGVAIVLVLPSRARRVGAILIGAVFGLLTVLKIIDIGFFAAFARPFDPVFDWSFFGPGLDFLSGSIGHAGALVAAIGAGVLAVAVVALMILAVVRLTRLVAGRRTVTTRTVALLAVIWIGCAVFGVRLSPGEPIAASSAAGIAYDGVRQASADMRDQQQFTSQVANDPFRDTPPDQLLTALRGKDVVLAFVESYGVVSIRNPEIAPPIIAQLNAGTRQLAAAGLGSRSAFITSPTFGGGSWLAHSTMESGVWIDSQRRYDDLVATDRMTLSSAFRAAGWRSVGDVPENNVDWPQGAFYHFNKLYDVRNVGYRGPGFAYADVPDQYTLLNFQRTERTPGHAPLFAEIDLISSHSPWTAVPRMVPWNQIGDGSLYQAMHDRVAQPMNAVWPDPAKVTAAFGQSIQYSLASVISYLATYGDKNLVFVFLGDHQPASIVSGPNASHDVPVSIVTGDPAVLNRISGWGWQNGLLPNSQAPVWPMDAFRNEFLRTFGGR